MVNIRDLSARPLHSPESPRMLLLVGLPGSGKSTLAKRLHGWDVVNQDTLGDRNSERVTPKWELRASLGWRLFGGCPFLDGVSRELLFCFFSGGGGVGPHFETSQFFDSQQRLKSTSNPPNDWEKVHLCGGSKNGGMPVQRVNGTSVRYEASSSSSLCWWGSLKRAALPRKLSFGKEVLVISVV